MFKHQKWVTLLLVCILVLSVTACGAGTTKDNAATGTTTIKETTTTAKQI